LANVEGFKPPQVLAVEQFVYDGGGLLIAPGVLSRWDHYNEVLYKGGAGVMPAALLEPTALDGAAETSLSGVEPDPPLPPFLGGRPDAFLSAVVGRYFPVAGMGSRFATNSGAAESGSTRPRVLAHYVTGDPFLIEP